MLLWIIFAFLTAAALCAVLWPWLRAGRAVPASKAYDAAVYRDQLQEIETDRARGLISEAEAEAAKTEISRRLLAAADAAEGGGGGGADGKSGVLVLVVAGLAIPWLSLVLYIGYGSPALRDLPLAARRDDTKIPSRLADLVRKVEERLREHPQDGRGWDVIAPVYLKQRRYQEAADAFARAIRLEGESTGRLAGYGEALVLANNGIVSEEARRAFEAALKRDPSLPRARFWIGMAKEQDGKFEEAAAIWRDMLERAPADAPWRGLVEQRWRQAETKLGRTPGRDEKEQPPAGPAPGPSEEDVAAARRMTPEQRTAMINQMVEGLARRLNADGKDLQGWLRLVRAYTVLGKRDKALDALKSARKSFEGDEKALAELADLEKSLGL